MNQNPKFVTLKRFDPKRQKFYKKTQSLLKNVISINFVVAKSLSKLKKMIFLLRFEIFL